MQDATDWTGGDLVRYARHPDGGYCGTVRVYGIEVEVWRDAAPDTYWYGLNAVVGDYEDGECFAGSPDPQAALDELRLRLRPYLPATKRDALALQDAIASGLQGALL